MRRVLGPDTAALFDDYECGTDLFGKAAKIERLLKRHDTAPERFLLVGDEMRDIDAARKAGSGSVPWPGATTTWTRCASAAPTN